MFLGSNFYNESNKENNSYRSNNEKFHSLNKEKAFPCFANLSTGITLKCQSVFSSNSSEYGKDLSFGKSNKTSKLTSNYESKQSNGRQQNNPFLMKNDGKKQEISHELIPIHLRDNENYKTILTKVIKNPKIKTNKTFTKPDFCQIDNYNKLSPDFSLLVKRKKVKSLKKIYIGDMRLKDNENKSVSFPFYRDEDVGVNEEWQDFIIEANIDEDCETEEEMISKLNEVVYNDLEEGINQLKNMTDSPHELITNFRGI